jgi:16S rRNA (cytosine1402-N4)-methyltransferase
MGRGAGHRPVLPDQVLELLAPAGRRIVIDCTVGPGGHASLLMSAAGPQATLIGLDVDEQNLRIARQRLSPFSSRVRLFRACFTELEIVLAEVGLRRVDLVLADLGVSSGQLDDPQRGLSFLADGPLDMRLDRRRVQTAAELVNRLNEKDLADLIYRYGEERYSRRIARAMVAARRTRPIERTTELARIVSGAYPAAARKSRRGVHPATRTFLALRIAVNDELGNLDRLLEHLPHVLAPKARVGIISFHSLEDRRVKRAFARWAQSGEAVTLTPTPVTPGTDEIRENPRSRSAKLRVIEWLAPETGATESNGVET